MVNRPRTGLATLPSGRSTTLTQSTAVVHSTADQALARQLSAACL